MNASSDPFAVSKYDPAKLPAARADLATSAFTDVMTLHCLLDEEGAFEQPIEVYDYLATNVLASYEPRKWAIFDPTRLFSEGATTVSGGWEEWTQATVPVDVADGQTQERRTRLSAAIRLKALSGEWPRHNVRRALVHALNLEKKVRKRDEAKRIAEVEGWHLAKGSGTTAAVKATSITRKEAKQIADKERGRLAKGLDALTPKEKNDVKRRRLKGPVAEGRIWGLHQSSGYIAYRDLIQGSFATDQRQLTTPSLVHSADLWFAGETKAEQVASADRVAAHIITLMQNTMQGKSKRGKRPIVPPKHLQWDAFMMVEGFAKRRIPLTPLACLMLDYALGLFDGEGRAVASPFCGIRKLDSFAAAAEVEGSEILDAADKVSVSGLLAAIKEKGEPSLDPKTLRNYHARATFQTLTDHARTAELRRLSE